MNKLEWVKKYRQATGASLYDAMAAFDAQKEQRGKDTLELQLSCYREFLITILKHRPEIDLHSAPIEARNLMRAHLAQENYIMESYNESN